MGGTWGLTTLAATPGWALLSKPLPLPAGVVRASSIFPILSAILLLLGGVCVAASRVYKAKRNIILGAGILFVAAGERQGRGARDTGACVCAHVCVHMCVWVGVHACLQRPLAWTPQMPIPRAIPGSLQATPPPGGRCGCSLDGEGGGRLGAPTQALEPH